MHIDAGHLLELLEQDLYHAGWDGCYIPYAGITKRQFAMQHLRRSLVKKYLPGTQDTTASSDAAALDLFLRINQDCRTWSLHTEGMSTWEEIAINEAKSFIEDFFYPDGVESILTLNKIYSGLNIGPGSSLGSLETDFYSKLATSSMTTTDPGLYILYKDAIVNDPIWSGMEHSRFKEKGLSVVTGSRLSFVPKTTEISRTICTEPLLNMLFQKGIGLQIEKRLRSKVGIYLSTQPDLNANLARLGSVNGEFGTIDLSSASDSISLSLCKELLPKQVYDLLLRTRSPSTTIPSGEEVELHMVSSMGNAFTFPLQTVIFVAVVVGSYRACGLKLKRHDEHTLGNFAVFGDDIIVDTRAYNLVCRVLSLLGFSVNHKKSFNDGDFRESCGSDYFQGHNVRGVYLKHLRDASDCYSAINRLVRYSSKHQFGLYNLVSFLASRCRFLPVPFDESDDAGIKVPERMLTRRFLHPHTKATYYSYLHLVDRRVKMDTGDRKPKLNGWFENPDGLLLAFLAGSIRTGFVSLRSNRRKSVIRRRYSSRWNYIAPDQHESVGSADQWYRSAEGHFEFVPFKQKRA